VCNPDRPAFVSLQRLQAFGDGLLALPGTCLEGVVFGFGLVGSCFRGLDLSVY
jgi:hypothetical protein